MRRTFRMPIAIAALCATVLLSRSGAQSSLVIGYALNETSGAIASDSSGSNANGALVDDPTWISPGRFGGGLMLDGTSQYVFTDSPNLPTEDFTWALWVKRQANAPFQTLFESQGATAAELEINLNNGAIDIYSSGFERLLTTSTVPTDVWTHVAVTREGNVIRAYINGVADEITGSDWRVFDFADCPLLIGVDADLGCTGALNGFLQGAIDDVQIHNRAFSEAEIQQMMAAPLGGGGPVPDTTAPVRSTSQPNITAPAGTTQLSIALTTNESATCRYELTPGIAYASMSSVFSSTGTTTHAQIVSGLTDGSTRTFYVKCQDAAANANADDFLITVTVALPGPPPPPPSAIYYVAPGGDDLNPGTLDEPFQTIERARQAVGSVNGSMSGDIHVVLRGGEYNVPSTLVFGPLDSGTNGHDVIYDAYPAERPVVHGGQHVTGWTPVGGGIYKAQVGALRFRQLYVNGTRAVRARTPNAGGYDQILSWDLVNRRVEVASSEVANWQRLHQVEMVILGRGVNQSNLRVSQITTSGGSAYVTGMDPERTRLFQQQYPPKEPLRPYYFENALEFLDTPGEWYLNTDTGEVHYMPRPGENLASADVVVPRLERLLSVAGTLDTPVRHLQFRNLTFAYSTWLRPDTEGFIGDQASVVYTGPQPADQISSYPGHRHPGAVHVEAADDVTFERNVFSHLGSSGLNLYAATHDNRVVGNVFTDISASGISVGLDLLGNPADPRQVSRRAVIQNNYLSETGVDFYQTVGIMVGYGDSTLIEHNELSKMPYSGISVGWGWADVDNAATNNLIRYNEIQDVVRTMSDGAGIYTLSRQPGTFISDNYVHDIVRTGVQGGFNISGLYLDEGSSSITTRDNVLQSTGDRRIFQNQNGMNNFFINNDGQSPATIDGAGLEPAYEDIRPGSTPPPDPDADGDGVPDTTDNCPVAANPNQADVDGDTIGDACDPDNDNDGVPDAIDAFPLDASESLDTDHDGIGNNADTDDDGDTVPDATDAFPLDASESVDTDHDGTGNNADTDDDNDGVLDVVDAFPLNASESVDTDHDGIGNNADPDDDNDGVPDATDAFPTNPAETTDADGDGTGNNADLDDDNDGMPDATDNCPLTANADQANADGDATGDACDPDTVSDEVTASDLVAGGGSVTLSNAADPVNGATPAQPVVVGITTTVPGTLTITNAATAPPAQYDVLGQQVSITVPPSPGAPYTITFELDATVVDGLAVADLEIFRNGVVVEDCTAPAPDATPDPCVASREVTADGDVLITVRSTMGSVWFAATMSAAVNNPPTLADLGAQRGDVSDQVSLQLGGSDVDGDTLTYEALSLPPGLSLNTATGLATGTLTTKGHYTVFASVSDGTSSAVRIFEWKVDPVNHRPDLKNVQDQTGEVGTQASLELRANDPDQEDNLVFSAVNLPPGLTLNATTGVISGTPTMPGVYDVTATVSDGSLTDSRTFRWTIRAVPAPKPGKK